MLPLWLLYILRALISSVTTFGLAMLFNSPLRVATIAAMIGAFINTARLLLVSEAHIQVLVTIGLTALVVGLFTTSAVLKTCFSRVTLSVPAVVTTIPGVPLYRSLTYLNNSQMIEAPTALFIIIFTIVSIGIGLAIARMLTDRN